LAFAVTRNPLHHALAVMIFFAARSEEAQVLFEERRRSAAKSTGTGQGIWVAPPGYRWVHRGNGLWQLAPTGVFYNEQAAAPDPTVWR
jgi:hypothetical protein